MICVVCGDELRPEQQQTCLRCIGRVRRDLLRISDLVALLPAVIHAGYPTNTALGQPHGSETPLPGGIALVMSANGSVGTAGGSDASADEWESDPDVVVAKLESWVRDWAELRDEPLPSAVATVASEVGYLSRLTGWAGAHHPAFDEFAAEVRGLRGSLERATATDEATVYGSACLQILPDGTTCGGQLVREYLPPCRRPECQKRGCTNEEHQGLSDWWTCRRCRRRTDHRGHNLAVHERLRLAAEATG